MSAQEIIDELPKLTEAERTAVFKRLHELSMRDETHLNESATVYPAVSLEAHGIGEAQAADLRSRLKTFAEDWERPEAAIYDEDPAR